MAEHTWELAKRMIAERDAAIVTLRDQKARAEADLAAMRVATEEAAQSLETLTRCGLGDDELLDDMSQVRGYANSRASVARAALAAGGTDEQG